MAGSLESHKARAWRRLMAGIDNSGPSVAFCRQGLLSVASFYYWRMRLASLTRWQWKLTWRTVEPRRHMAAHAPRARRPRLAAVTHKHGGGVSLAAPTHEAATAQAAERAVAAHLRPERLVGSYEVACGLRVVRASCAWSSWSVSSCFSSCCPSEFTGWKPMPL